MDTKLRWTHPSFECQQTEITQALMEPLAVVEAFNKRKDGANTEKGSGVFSDGTISRRVA